MTELAQVRTLEEVMAAHIRNVLDQVHGNQSKAARLLGMHRSRVRRWMVRIGYVRSARSS